MSSASWFRAYHSRELARSRDVVTTLIEHGFVEKLSSRGHEDVFDIQAIRLGHFQLTRGPAVVVSGDWADLVPGADLGELRGTTQIMFHGSGFMVLRVTVTDVPGDPATPEGAAALAALERLLWLPTSRLTWRVAGHEVTGNVRHCLNLVFMALNEVIHGRSPDRPDLPQLAQEGPTGCAALHRLAIEGEISYSYPVSLGTHIEIVSPEAAADPVLARSIVSEVGREAGLQTTTSSLRDVGGDLLEHQWYVGELQSFLFLPDGRSDESATSSSDHTRLLEFLTLRRGVLRSLQRDTQRIILDAGSVSRRRIEEWHLLLSSTTDDYVLNDRIARNFALLLRHHDDADDLRSVGDLESQVRRNLDSFRSRLEWSSQSLSTIIGAIFAAVAAIIGLSSLVRLVVATLLGEDAGTLTEDHPGVTAAIDAGLTLFAFVVTWFLVHRTARRVSMGRPT
jgi:hypothetical protein